jgi:NAD-dependent dihydropyrimidine dehydrogenase PreA subunit
MEAFRFANPVTPCEAVRFDAELCTRCGTCIEVCRSDVLVPDTEGGPPILLYPDECWFCGCCVGHCPVDGAITMVHPLTQRVGWKRRDTGEHYRTGMKNPPPPNTRPPAGGW